MGVVVWRLESLNLKASMHHKLANGTKPPSESDADSNSPYALGGQPWWAGIGRLAGHGVSANVLGEAAGISLSPPKHSSGDLGTIQVQTSQLPQAANKFGVDDGSRDPSNKEVKQPGIPFNLLTYLSICMITWLRYAVVSVSNTLI